jgi:hypothetical protein
MSEKQDGISYLMFTNRDTNHFLWNMKRRKEILEADRPKEPLDQVEQEDDG